MTFEVLSQYITNKVFESFRRPYDDRNLVDPASSHMLVSKIKPCMSKYKQFVLWNCEWLIKSVIVYLILPYYLDNRGNSRANTCKNGRLLEAQYLLDKKPISASCLLVNHDNYSNRMTQVGDGSFKFLPYQLSMVG